MSRTRKIKLTLPGRFEPTEEIVTFVNPGEWFKKRWLVGVGAGFSCIFYVVEGGCEQDVIDNLVDSDWGHILKTEEKCEACRQVYKDYPDQDKEPLDPDDEHLQELWNECTCSFAGNYSERVDLDDIQVLQRI